MLTTPHFIFPYKDRRILFMDAKKKSASRLEGKDLITIGIYTVIYVVIVMLVAMLGFIPIFIPLMAVLCPLIGGIPYMLYVTKAKKFGMTAIMGFLIGLVMVFFGNGYLTMVTGLVGGLIADVILKNGGYKSAAVIMHGGAIMMLLAAAGLPRRSPVEWTSENGRGYSLLVTPSLYFKSGAFEVYGII